MKGIVKFQQIASCHIRRIGHTETAIEVVKSRGGVLIVATNQQAEEIKRKHGIRCIALQDDIESKFLGLRCVIVLDHHALDILLHEVWADIQAVQKESIAWQNIAKDLAAALKMCKPTKLRTQDMKALALANYNAFQQKQSA